MHILFNILLVLHIVGFGIVFGGTIAQFPRLKEQKARVTAGVLHASTLLLVTGIAMLGLMHALNWHPNDVKYGIKLLVLVAIYVLVLMNRKKEQVSGGVLGAITGLAAFNVALVVLWQ